MKAVYEILSALRLVYNKPVLIKEMIKSLEKDIEVHESEDEKEAVVPDEIKDLLLRLMEQAKEQQRRMFHLHINRLVLAVILFAIIMFTNSLAVLLGCLVVFLYFMRVEQVEMIRMSELDMTVHSLMFSLMKYNNFLSEQAVSIDNPETLTQVMKSIEKRLKEKGEGIKAEATE